MQPNIQKNAENTLSHVLFPNYGNNPSIGRDTPTVTQGYSYGTEQPSWRLGAYSIHTRISNADTFPLGSNYNSPSTFGQISLFEKLENEIKELGHRIKYREVNIQFLKSSVNKLDHEIAEYNIALGNLSSTYSPVTTEDGDTEDVIVDNILQHENSAAAVICGIKNGFDMSSHSVIKDVVGVVAMLGSTDDPRLSSVLSEFLGREKMLSLVCKTFESGIGLESYDSDGSIDKSSGIHGFAADVMGISIDDRFKVYCLDDIRPYPGGFIVNDPHRRLDLVKPSLNGETLSGFLGFAVNMISIDKSNMYCMSKAGNTLRETLFYDLFSSLQVYTSREEMLKAEPFITNGAVSLDGGMILRNGVYVMGQQKSDIDVKFPFRSGSFQVKGSCAIEATENRLKETVWKKRRYLEDLEREQKLLDHAKSAFQLKKTEFVSVLDSGAAWVGLAATPR